MNVSMLDTYVWVPEAGAFVSERVRRVAEIVHDYDPGLFIAPIPDSIRAQNPGKSHALIHEGTEGLTYVVKVLAEDEISEDLLVWLWTHDNAKDNVLERIEKRDQARRAIEMKRVMEERAETKEIGQAILNSPLHTYRHNGKIYR